MTINEETKAADIAFPDPLEPGEEARFRYLWELLKNLGVAEIIKIYGIKDSNLNFEVIPKSSLAL